MGRICKGIALALALLFTGASGIGHADDAELNKTLLGVYANMVKAFKAKDLKALMAPLTPDVSVKLPDGKTWGKTELEKEYKQEFTETKEVKEWNTVITKLVVKGNTATATVKSKVVLVVTINGRNATIQNDQEGVDTWVKTPSGWKLKSEAVTKSQNKPLPAKPAASDKKP